MEDNQDSFYDGLIKNIARLINDKHIKQAALAEYAGISQSQMSKVLKGEVSLSIKQLSSIARCLETSVIDIITYPDKYVIASTKIEADEPVDAVLQIKLSKEKKDQVFQLIFGENCLEILNK